MWVSEGVGASEATDLAVANPGAAEWRQSVYRPLYAVCPLHLFLFDFNKKTPFQ